MHCKLLKYLRSCFSIISHQMMIVSKSKKLVVLTTKNDEICFRFTTLTNNAHFVSFLFHYNCTRLLLFSWCSKLIDFIPPNCYRKITYFGGAFWFLTIGIWTNTPVLAPVNMLKCWRICFSWTPYLIIRKTIEFSISASIIGLSIVNKRKTAVH